MYHNQDREQQKKERHQYLQGVKEQIFENAIKQLPEETRKKIRDKQSQERQELLLKAILEKLESTK